MDLAKAFSKEAGRTGSNVVLSDINEAMLEVGRERLLNAGCNVDFVLANAETLARHLMMKVLIWWQSALGYATSPTKTHTALDVSVLKRRSSLILEFSKPVFEPFGKVYDLYSIYRIATHG